MATGVRLNDTFWTVLLLTLPVLVGLGWLAAWRTARYYERECALEELRLRAMEDEIRRRESSR